MPYLAVLMAGEPAYINLGEASRTPWATLPHNRQVRAALFLKSVKYYIIDLGSINLGHVQRNLAYTIVSSNSLYGDLFVTKRVHIRHYGLSIGAIPVE